jgi:FAD/FMN-containing dehydrogenase
MSLSTFLSVLSPVLGERGIATDPADLAPWLTDWRRRFTGAAPALLSPASTAEVVAIVRAAAEHRVALVPQGGNTSMVGGATPPAEGGAVLLSMRRMNRLRAIDAEAGKAVAEAGVVLADLHAAAANVGRRFPLTLGARGSATIGGLVSTNAGGTQVLRWGSMRALVAGLEAVMPDGGVIDTTAALKKDNRGYDLTQLLIGAEGTLGIVTAATLRLVPAVTARGVAWAAVASPADALALLRRLEGVTNTVESFELIPAEMLSVATTYLGVRPPIDTPAAWHVLIEAVATDAAAEPPAEALARWLAPALEDGSIGDAVIAASEAQAEAFWRLRDTLSDAKRALGPAVNFDISVPVETMPAFLPGASCAAEARFPGTSASGYGHLGDGNIHFHVRAPAGAEPARWYADDAPGITRFVHDLVTDAGGSIAAEHGIGQMKRDELARLVPPARLAAMRAIKAALDPLGLMNPGKLLAPLAPERGLA